MSRHVAGASEPLSCELIAGGRSNLTYRVTNGSGRGWVVRRPPTGPLLARAHDMRREYRILRALWQHTPVPVPEPVALCDDESVLGVPFYVMADVPGAVLREPGDAVALDEDVRAAAAFHAVDVLAALHSVDIDRAGLADLGPSGGYVGRQLRRWLSQVEQSGDMEAITLLGRQQEALLTAAPVSAKVTLVHGDYRFDNLVVDSHEGTVRAVLDWEIATLGDPLADLGSFLVYWDEPDDERPALGITGPTAARGFPSRHDVAARYAEALALDLDALDFYVAFGYWKLACILHGVAHRYRSGAGGGARADALPVDMSEHTRWLAHRSADHLSRYRARAR
jgi:aminoglycoside phosphotransferase (APT) family kinase protein